MMPQLNRAMLYSTVAVTVTAAALFSWMKSSNNPSMDAAAWSLVVGVGGVWLTFILMMFLLQVFLHKPWTEKDRSLAQLEAQNKVYQEIFNITKKVNAASSEAQSVERGMQASVETLREELKLDGCSIRMLDPVSKQLLAISGCGYRDPNRKPMPLPATMGVAGKAISERRSIFVEDTTQEADFVQSPGHPPIMSLFCIPLIAQGEVVGVLSGSSRSLRTFNEHERQILDLVSSRLAGLMKQYSMLPAEQRNLTDVTGSFPAVKIQ
jgi:transcriptional regulator with GAF, ATPase, and Fis domain